jgi:centrosomal protein CEP104
MSRITFTVASCSSEDPEFPAQELDRHTPETKGWVSPKFCEYPQEIVLSFLGRAVTAKQVQILSHQSKIPTKIELFAGIGSHVEDATYRRLGYLSLDSNVRSEYKVREGDLGCNGSACGMDWVGRARRRVHVWRIATTAAWSVWSSGSVWVSV